MTMNSEKTTLVRCCHWGIPASCQKFYFIMAV
jgi:hypothetical protein